ncbi:MAG: DsrE family protein [Desulfobacterales bacterium]
MFKKIRFSCASMVLVLMLGMAGYAVSADYAAMEGVDSANAVFDFRIGEAQKALGHLKLIHTMVNDPGMVINGEQPEIVIVLIGPSVKLVTTEKAKSNQAQQGALAEQISKMDKDGITFEICMAAAHAFDVSADVILPEIQQVPNGWISVIGYQQRGYALIADF